MALIGAKPRAVEQQQLEPEHVIDHEEEQHEDQGHPETTTQLQRGQRH